MVGGDYIERNYEAAAVEGRVVQIAFQGSPRANVDFRRIMLKRLTHTGSTLRSRAAADKAAIARAVEENAWPLIAAGRIAPVMDQAFPLVRSGQGPCADGIERAYRENRPHGVSSYPSPRPYKRLKFAAAAPQRRAQRPPAAAILCAIFLH